MRRSRNLPSRIALLTLGTALFLSGCTAADGSADSGAAGANPSGDVTVLQPGSPGEPAETVEPGQASTPPAWNHSDVAFVQMMIPHHAQALEMSRLADTRAADSRVEALARRIRGAQGPEIMTMAAWLQERNIDVPKAGEDPAEYDHGEHGHIRMTGILTPEQMDALAAARGRRFDRLFLEDMIRHHRGAIAMAEAVARDGADLRVSEMSAEVGAGQAAEIERMRDLLREV